MNILKNISIYFPYKMRQTTIHKDKYRKYEMNLQNINTVKWFNSLKYSSFLMKKENQNKQYELCFEMFNEFQHSLKNLIKNKNIKNEKSYQVWDTMIKTIQKDKNDVKLALTILHQTNLYKVC